MNINNSAAILVSLYIMVCDVTVSTVKRNLPNTISPHYSSLVGTFHGSLARLWR